MRPIGNVILCRPTADYSKVINSVGCDIHTAWPGIELPHYRVMMSHYCHAVSAACTSPRLNGASEK